MSLLSKSDLETLLEHRNGPVVSIFMPTHRLGDQIRQDSIRLKNLMGQAEDRLREEGLRPRQVEKFLEPVRAMVDTHSFWRRQSDGLAVFCASDEFQFHRLPLDFEELLLVSDHFYVKPLLPLLSGDGRFYVLALSQSEIRLLQGSRHSVSQVDLDDVPESLAEVLKWDDPEKRLQWHTRTGARKPGGRAAVFHGHGAPSEDDPKDYIRRYFHRIDAGLSELLADQEAPLILAGVDYLHPIYAEANSYPYLMDEGVVGNPEILSPEALHEQAWDIVQPYFQQEREEAAAQYRRVAGAGADFASGDLREVVAAAYQGRVDVLFVPVGIQRWGTYDPSTNEVHGHQEAEAGDGDLLDFAAVHTLVNGGTVYAVEPEDVPGGASLAALFRF